MAVPILLLLILIRPQAIQGETILAHFRALHDEFQGFSHDPEILVRLDQDVDGDGVPELFLHWAGGYQASEDVKWAVYSRRVGRACFLGWVERSGNYILPASAGRNLRWWVWDERPGVQSQQDPVISELQVSAGEISSSASESPVRMRQLPPGAIPMRLERARMKDLAALVGADDQSAWVPRLVPQERTLSVTRGTGSAEEDSDAPVLRCGTAEALAYRDESIAEHFRRVQIDPRHPLEPAVLERIDLDLDLDGTSEVLLSADDPTHRWGGGGETWHVYKVGDQRPCWAGRLVMDADLSRFDESRKALVVAFASDRHWSWERTYRLSGGRLEFEDQRWAGTQEARVVAREKQLAQIAEYWRRPTAPSRLAATAGPLIRGGAPGDELWRDARGSVVSLTARVGSTVRSGRNGPFSAVLPCHSADEAAARARP